MNKSRECHVWNPNTGPEEQDLYHVHVPIFEIFLTLLHVLHVLPLCNFLLTASVSMTAAPNLTPVDMTHDRSVSMPLLLANLRVSIDSNRLVLI